MALNAFVRQDLARSAVPEVVEAAREVAGRLNGIAVLFYGSILRTGDLDGLVDFYVLTEEVRGRGLSGWASRVLWPDISFQEVRIGNRTVRAKVATMPLSRFASAASGQHLDTTIWTRFVQPSALIWAADAAVHEQVVRAVASAAVTAARFAAVLGPTAAQETGFWEALFRETYNTELRVERPGREREIVAHDPERYARLLRLAWDSAGIAYSEEAWAIRPIVPAGDCVRLMRAWSRRHRAGKVLNAARLVKAAILLEGSGRYAIWKINRHTGLDIPVTRRIERHPVLSAPGVLWKVWRASSAPR